jgi:hypothetical protein
MSKKRSTPLEDVALLCAARYQIKSVPNGYVNLYANLVDALQHVYHKLQVHSMPSNGYFRNQVQRLTYHLFDDNADEMVNCFRDTSKFELLCVCVALSIVPNGCYPCEEDQTSIFDTAKEVATLLPILKVDARLFKLPAHLMRGRKRQGDIKDMLQRQFDRLDSQANQPRSGQPNPQVQVQTNFSRRGAGIHFDMNQHLPPHSSGVQDPHVPSSPAARSTHTLSPAASSRDQPSPPSAIHTPAPMTPAAAPTPRAHATMSPQPTGRLGGPDISCRVAFDARAFSTADQQTAGGASEDEHAKQQQTNFQALWDMAVGDPIDSTLTCLASFVLKASNGKERDLEMWYNKMSTLAVAATSAPAALKQMGLMNLVKDKVRQRIKFAARHNEQRAKLQTAIDQTDIGAVVQVLSADGCVDWLKMPVDDWIQQELRSANAHYPENLSFWHAVLQRYLDPLQQQQEQGRSRSVTLRLHATTM